MEEFRFNTLDYAVFAMMLALSVASGVYFGFCRLYRSSIEINFLISAKHFIFENIHAQITRAKKRKRTNKNQL
jgi:hypothetical protein